ncbi:MAG: phosphoribosylaminoimidazolesuccinocarboxamide synthase [Candidatus Bathyarchaeia archaeon]
MPAGSYEGKTKIVSPAKSPTNVILRFKNDITALDGEKHDVIEGKGAINASISSKLFELLNRAGLPTHFIRRDGPDGIVVKKLRMLPLEVVCRNVAAGHFAKRFSTLFKIGEALSKPVVEFYLKSDELHDPLLTEDHISLLGIASDEQVETMKELTLRTNGLVSKYLDDLGIRLVDFKLEFGLDEDDRLVIGDELALDSMRLWDKDTGSRLDKDVYRSGKPLDDVLSVYREAYRRIVGREAP